MVYFNNAATTWPKPENVYKEVNAFFRQEGVNPGRSQDLKTMNINRKIFDTREKLANFFGQKDSSRFVFTSGATESLNLAIKGLLNRGDHVISTRLEHNSVIRPLNDLIKEGRITVDYLSFNKKGIIERAMIEDVIKDSTALIVISHASNVLGTVNNIREIADFAQQNNIKILLDAAQTAGVLEINLNQIKVDMLSIPGHKSLYGPPGIGSLFIRKNINLDTLMEGGTGSNSLNTSQPEVMPDKYESGTMNTLGIIGLGAGLDFIRKTEINKIYKHEINLLKNFIEGLSEIKNIVIYGSRDLKQKVGVLSINLSNLSAAKFAYLLQNEYNISVRSGLHCAPFLHKEMGTVDKGMVRFSFSFFNTLDEVNYALNVIDDIAKKEG
ncbi:MAG: aminotransferase class V-fold PLP-dependent enzyme [Halanaerobiales bacterium]|nr:aminotransferase class V-fold PLP-dependent enzyme [Halanaerobiales bacterium]